jgi:hypothetical protein
MTFTCWAVAVNLSLQGLLMLVTKLLIWAVKGLVLLMLDLGADFIRA